MDCAIKLLFAFNHENKGNVGMLFGLLILPMFATVGMAIDYGQAITAHQKLQTLVDKAAIAGARLPATSSANRIEAATDFFADNLAHSGLSGVSSEIKGNNAEVSVSATYNHPTAIMKLFGHTEFNLTALARARAQVDNGGVACLLALSESATDGLHLQGINKASSENCWAWVNSSSPTSINASGAALGTAQGFCTHGGIVGADHFSPRPYGECDRLEDPFREKFLSYDPPSGECTFTDLELKSGDHRLRPGIYCGDTVLKPHAHVTLEPGTYVFRNGYLEVQGQSSLAARDTTLFFRGFDTRLIVRGGGDVDLRAPETGQLAGFAIVDRKFDSFNANVYETIIQGGGRIKIEGIVYAPQWRVNISGNGAMNEESACFAMIADHFYLEGYGQLNVRSTCDEAGLPQLMPKIKSGPQLLQ
ncbi:MAG: pilus assembly protein [Alphaproteobacteria bacterium]|nr:pilus assembly protein [Alphaproteobacteria bacterium]